MTLANDSILTGDTGSAVATHTISAKEHQVFMQADNDGHLWGTPAAYLIQQSPRVTGSSAADLWDLFNATGSGKILRIRGIWPLINYTTSIGFLASWQFDVIRTSAVGTGGTSATFNGTAAPGGTALNIAQFSTVDSPALPAQITARALPTGGATAAGFWFSMHLNGEETNPFTHGLQGVNMIPQLPQDQPFELQENQGLKIRQISAVASTGLGFGWLLAFALIP